MHYVTFIQSLDFSISVIYSEFYYNILGFVEMIKLIKQVCFNKFSKISKEIIKVSKIVPDISQTHGEQDYESPI